ncbi:hypothetical protein HDV01_005881 [Terramyces sp. JEL0728]|nr:hypothetical protein HDV01_005881 [Terramyces sp. JEL0728]
MMLISKYILLAFNVVAQTASNLYHPAGLFGQCQLTRLTGLSPTSPNVVKLSQTTPLDLTLAPSYSNPILNLYSYTSNTNYVSQSAATFDGLVRYASRQSYQQAVMYLVTGNAKYADNAIAIIQNWTAAAQTPSYFPNYFADCPSNLNWWMCQNSPLNLGWVSVSWFRVAEILKFTYNGWNASNVEQVLVNWFENNQIENLWKSTTLISPTAKQAQYGMGNWHSTMTEGLMNYYFLKNNITGIQYVMQYYQRMVQGSSIFPPFYVSNGEECEICRDIEHANYGTGSLVQIAETFWHQGVDLYSYGPAGYAGLPGLAQVLETTAYIILYNAWPPNVVSVDLGWGNCSTFTKNGFTPGGFHIGYNHYVNRLGLSMPYTQLLIAQNADTAYYFNWGLGVLTHTSTGTCDSVLGAPTFPTPTPMIVSNATKSKAVETTVAAGLVGSVVLVIIGGAVLYIRKRQQQKEAIENARSQSVPPAKLIKRAGQ